jgi:hypothetical protein
MDYWQSIKHKQFGPWPDFVHLEPKQLHGVAMMASSRARPVLSRRGGHCGILGTSQISSEQSDAYAERLSQSEATVA